MIVLLCFLFFSLVSASPFLGEVEVKEQNNSLDDLLRQTLEYGRWLLQRHEPVSIPSLPEFHFTSDDVKVTFSSKDVKISELKDFTIDKISNIVSKDGVTSSYGVTIPQIHLEGTYSVFGTAFKKNVTGSGTFSVEMSKIVQSGVTHYTIVEHYLQIQDLNLDYQLSGAKFNVAGLKIDGVTQGEVEDFLNTNFVAYLENNKTTMCQEITSRLIAVLSQILYGLTYQDVVNWLQHMVETTPDPPPLPWSH